MNRLGQLQLIQDEGYSHYANKVYLKNFSRFPNKLIDTQDIKKMIEKTINSINYPPIRYLSFSF